MIKNSMKNKINLLFNGFNNIIKIILTPPQASVTTYNSELLSEPLLRKN